MTLKTFKVFLCSLVFISTSKSFAGPGIVVGNSGDGYLTEEGRVLLRDFVESGIDPHIGYLSYEKLKLELPEVKTTLSLSNEEERALRIYLAKAQVLAPPLGRILQEVIKSHYWRFTNYPLEKIRDLAELIETPPTYSLIQIANRRDRTVYIHRDSWEMMPKEHKVGLVIHEAFSSLLKPICLAPGECKQEARRARELTSVLFSLEYPKINLASIAKDYLSIDWNIPLTTYKSDSWIISVLEQKNHKENKHQYFFSSATPFNKVNEFYQTICSNHSLEIADPQDEFKISLTKNRINFDLVFFDFPANFNHIKTRLTGLRVKFIDKSALTIKSHEIRPDSRFCNLNKELFISR